MQSVRQVGATIGSKVGKVAILMKHDDDAVICAAARAKKGGFKDMCLEDLLSAALSGVAEKAQLSDKSLVENVAVGNVLAQAVLRPFRGWQSFMQAIQIPPH
ncbi:hypothetical protein H4Q26_014757 [Puccinia striiformis f. sp. tritici PST-130]|nr:hypothetical protein H4Q26_014757 [Puccinia striiformis f. sp. tritici PST-130]